MATATYADHIRTVYENTLPVTKMDFSESAVLVNDLPLQEEGIRSLCEVFNIPKGYFEKASIDLKQRMLREAIHSMDEDSVRVATDVKKTEAFGLVTTEKVRMALQAQFLSKFEASHEVGILGGNDLSHMYSAATINIGEFMFADSKYITGLMMRLRLYGRAVSDFFVRILREVCTNGMTAAITSSKLEMDNFIMKNAFVEGCLSALQETAPRLEGNLTRMKSMIVDPYEVLREMTPKIPKTAGNDALKWLRAVEDGSCEELPQDLVRTQYGAINAVTAGARNLSTPTRIKVESVALNYTMGFTDIAA